jgi:hypothetical protein
MINPLIVFRNACGGVAHYFHDGKSICDLIGAVILICMNWNGVIGAAKSSSDVIVSADQ